MTKRLFPLVIIVLALLAACNQEAKNAGIKIKNDTTRLMVLTFEKQADSCINKPVIIEGTRRRKEVEELDKLIPELDVALKFPENPREKFKGIHLNVDEWKVVSYVNPKNTVRMIMKQLNMSEVEIKRVILALNQAGLVEIVAKTAPKPAPGVPTTAAGGRAQQRAAARKPDAALIGKLIDRLRSM